MTATEEVLTDLAEFVAIPSDSRHASPETMRAAAEWLAGRLAFVGGRVEETRGNPVVRADWTGAPGKPIVLVYGHYDVQPTGDLAEWTTPPYELTRTVVRGEDVVRGRGATDDKGPVLQVVHLVRRLLAERGTLPVNLRFLLEGEEEIGSPHLGDYVRAHATDLACDLVVSADGAMWRPSEPSISIASKGLVSLDVVVTGSATDLHSGRYGGTVANPVHALARVIASFHDADGRVAVPSFYDGAPDPTPERRAELEAIEFDEEAYRAGLGVPALAGEAGFDTLTRLWERPTLEVNGVTGGGKYSVIPHTATAHVTCRLVGEQDPGAVVAAVIAHVHAHAPAGVAVQVVDDGVRVPAYRIPPDHPAVVAGRAALADVHPGEDVLLAVIAGTLPCTALFEEVLGVKTLFFSFATADEQHHAPDEFFRVARIGAGIAAWTGLLDRLGEGS
ncbi:M20/M25/M40 family metallo-hydrolase [Klenkia sp. PcliD-1-E]|uniref:M20/M25/M40 family metallo-hydrolase n=1 Tax=Klenkia sp. PcliD-1-E TaxID=2954492 RepID=UPI002097925B|nr:M20/M25/M40 family metallo-hydrolase [Klenkia sp. PcliD-1-E]MCO7218663.1 M20/M25/M40 family metallo-hydrolase [Klenkia sp. PcliD-1-E]